MENAIVTWLADFGAAAFRWSVLAFVVINGTAIAAVVLTRDRALVNRWTSRLVATNLLLLGTGVGLPLASSACRLVVSAMFSGTSSIVPDIDRKSAERNSGQQAPVTPR